MMYLQTIKSELLVELSNEEESLVMGGGLFTDPMSNCQHSETNSPQDSSDPGNNSWQHTSTRTCSRNQENTTMFDWPDFNW
jgi:hypothetical protein